MQKVSKTIVERETEESHTDTRSPLHEEDLEVTGTNSINPGKLPGVPYSKVANENVDSDHSLHPETFIHNIFKPMLRWLNPLIDIAKTGKISESDIWEVPSIASVEVYNVAFIQ
jgi:hypothetical protein